MKKGDKNLLLDKYLALVTALILLAILITNEFFIKKPPINKIILPTLTPSPVITPTKTQEPTRTPSAFDIKFFAQQAEIFGTLTARGVTCDYENGFHLEAYINLVRYSPDKQWTVFTCSTGAPGYGKRYTAVVKINGSKFWQIPLDDFTWSKGEEGLMGIGMDVYRWTTDGNYVYLISQKIPDGGFYGYFLYRLNLKDGSFIEILPQKENSYYSPYLFELSPNDNYLAYTDYKKDPLSVYVRNMATETEKSIKIDSRYVSVGSPVWSLNSKSVLFVGGLDGWEEKKAGVSLLSIDIETMSLHTLLDNDIRQLVPFYMGESYWLQENVILLSPRDDYENIWSFDTNNKLLVLLPTPTPQP